MEAAETPNDLALHLPLVQTGSAVMACEVTEALAADGCYDFLHDGVVVGRLVWIADVCAQHPLRGWWLSIPDIEDELIYRVPERLFTDLPWARASSVSMALGLARHMLADRVEGLLDADG
jgi:hypothetical protein